MSFNKKPVLGSLLRAEHSIVKSLTGYWLFNEGGGGTAFDNLHNNNGAIQSSVDWTKQGLNFNETGDYVNCGNAGKFLKSKGTIFFQYKQMSFPGGYYYWCCLDDDFEEFCLNSDGSAWISFWLNTNNGQLSGSNWQDIIDGGTHSCVFTWDVENNYRGMYLDGIFVTSVSTAITWDAAGIAAHDFLIGGRLIGANRHAGGDKNHFGIADRMFTDAEIMALHINPYQIFELMFIPSTIIAADGDSFAPIYYETLMQGEL